MKEMTMFKQRIKDITRGQREGKVIAKNEVADVQKQVIGTLSHSELDTADKGKFLAAMKNVKTQNQLEKALPDIKQRIVDLEELRDKQRWIKQFKKLGNKANINKLRP